MNDSRSRLLMIFDRRPRRRRRSSRRKFARRVASHHRGTGVITVIAVHRPTVSMRPTLHPVGTAVGPGLYRVGGRSSTGAAQGDRCQTAWGGLQGKGAVMNRHVAKPLAVAGVLGACAFAVPTASALQDQRGPDPQNQAPVVQQQSDLRSPDARDAVSAGQQRTAVSNDLRSPDARDAVSAGQQRNAVSNDLRSPDAQDAVSAGQQRNAVSNDLRSPDAQDAAGNTSLASYAVPT